MMSDPQSQDSNTSFSAGVNVEVALYNKAIELLSRREHSRRELCQKWQAWLQRQALQNIPDTSALFTKLLTKLENAGFQSDSRYANAFCRSRLQRGYGSQRVLLELNQKGISQLLAEEALELASSEDLMPEQVLLRTWQKKFRSLGATPNEKAKQYRFLRARGFSHSQISALFQSLKEQ